EPNQVIGETLERATSEASSNPVPALAEAIKSAAEPPLDYESFRVHSLASWIESIFGIQKELETQRWIRQAPRKLRGTDSACEHLAKLTETDPEQCYRVLRSFLIRGSQLRRNASSRFPIFAFRLHQFFTRGDTVWSTMESESARYLEMSKKGSKPGDS